MIIIPPSNEMELLVYKELKENPYWTQLTIAKSVNSDKVEILYKFSEGEKAVIYDTFKQIDKLIHPNYDKIDLHKYLLAIDKECNNSNNSNNTWKNAIKKIINQVFSKDIDGNSIDQNTNKYTQEVEDVQF